MCVSNVKPVKQITFLCHSITITSAVITKDYPSWQAFEREGKGSFRRERNARGAWSRALIPFLFPFPFERLPRRLTKDRLKVISLSTLSYMIFTVTLMLSPKNVCSIFFAGTYFCGSLENRKNWNPKNFGHTVSESQFTE